MSVSCINRNILSFLKRINHLSTQKIDAMIVSAFGEYNGLNPKCIIISELKGNERELERQLLTMWKRYQQSFDLENLIELFEFVISPAEKEVNGAVYTPRDIREYIVDEVLRSINEHDIKNAVIGDLSCGCGGFLITLAHKLHHQFGLTYKWIYEHNIVGVDVASYSIDRTKILLKLLALLDGEVINGDINIFCQNSLSFDFQRIAVVKSRNGFDAIVGNPPYVSSAKMSDETKSLIARFSTAMSGKADLYIPFFQLAIEALRNDGILGYITVNNFYRSVNGRLLRKWFADNAYYIKLIDFGGEQIFKSRSTYTCLCFVHKKQNGCVDYVKSTRKQLDQIARDDYAKIQYDRLNHLKGWLLTKKQMADAVLSIEECGRPLGERYPIVNGFATLHNRVYVFRPIQEDEDTYTLSCKYGLFRIEKSICREAVKPNILQSETDIERYMEKVIFPYCIEDNQATIIPEDEMLANYPLTYRYLSACKNDLAKRDKGKREYEEWYGYGRNQALNVPGYKLLFPYIAERPRFILCERKDLLFYNGYAICSDSIEELIIIKKILQTTLFWEYICTTSKPYSNGYYALAKNYVKYFGIPNLTKRQKEFLLKESSGTRINDFVKGIYFG